MKRFVSLFLLAILSLSLLLSGCAEPEPAPAPDAGHGDAPYMNDFLYDSVEELSGPHFVFHRGCAPGLRGPLRY